MGTSVQTAQRKKDFLDAFRQCGNVVKACEETVVSRRSVYDWKDNDAAFLADFQLAEKESVEHLEREVHRRGVLGWEEPVYQGGKHVGIVRKFSDTLLIFLLKGAAPDKYKDRQELHHKGGVALGTSELTTPEQREAFRRFVLDGDGA